MDERKGSAYNYYSNYTITNIEKLLKLKGKLYLRAYYDGDIEALELLLDIEFIVKKCNLSHIQRTILERYYFDRVTQVTIAKDLDISQQGVMKHIKKIRDELEKVFIAQRG